MGCCYISPNRKFAYLTSKFIYIVQGVMRGMIMVHNLVLRYFLLPRAFLIRYKLVALHLWEFGNARLIHHTNLSQAFQMEFVMVTPQVLSRIEQRSHIQNQSTSCSILIVDVSKIPYLNTIN